MTIIIALALAALSPLPAWAASPRGRPGNCCSFDRLEFITSTREGPDCGAVNEAGGARQPLGCGNLHLGGAGVALDLPWAVPDHARLTLDIAKCDRTSSRFTLTATRSHDTGSIRTCSTADEPTPEYPGRNGCLFGPPAPGVNPSSPGVSSCIVFRAASSASGTGDCGDGSLTGSIGLLADLYVTGDLLDGSASDRPDVRGTQPCPICDPRTQRCQGGRRHGERCTGVGSTTHDCPPPESHFVTSIPISLTLTTGTATRTSNDLPAQPFVFCGYCGQRLAPSFEGRCAGGMNDGAECATAVSCPDGACTAAPCTRDADCTTAPFTTCRQRTPGAFRIGTARTIEMHGTTAGASLADGGDHAATLVSVFCVPPSFNPTVGPAADLPSAGAISLAGSVRLVHRRGER